MLPKPQQLVATKSVKEHQLPAKPEPGGGGSTLSNQLSTDDDVASSHVTLLGVNISFFLVNAPPERGPELHKHDYDEVIIVQEGRTTCVAGDVQLDVNAGDIIVIPAGTPHRFVNSGNTPPRQNRHPRHPEVRYRMVGRERSAEEGKEQLINGSAVST